MKKAWQAFREGLDHVRSKVPRWIPRIGDGHAGGMGRLGFREFSRILVAFPDQHLQEDMAIFGNATPQESSSTKKEAVSEYETRMQAARDKAEKGEATQEKTPEAAMTTEDPQKEHDTEMEP